MPAFEFLSPLDQPFATARAAEWLKNALTSKKYNEFLAAVAFAKEGALKRLLPALDAFRKGGGNAEIVFGIDQQGTSRQALELALTSLDASYVWNHPSPYITFHPKAYLFSGHDAALAIIGSSNLTVGGLETNSEMVASIAFDLPNENAAWTKAQSWWKPLIGHANCAKLTADLIKELDARGLLLDETAPGSHGCPPPKGEKGTATGAPYPFPFTKVVPPSSAPTAGKGKSAAAGSAKPISATAKAYQPSALLIQIIPHENGEIFLSVTAVNQYPAFLGWPFKGKTTPKKKGNKPYPMLQPDPITNWRLFDKSGSVAQALTGWNLNTIYYDKKSEIRITVPPSLAAAIPEYSLLEMRRASQGSGVDFYCDVYPNGSPQYASMIGACTQTLPSGGKPVARKYGWI
ncbi:phospholipase D family protein [Anaeromyxobacter sp. Fw109-5]|uniref:phospholipase D family protein n=1 Tax=Anaeromyxobacter sp. (strain Fw109-5) TaxID=404589 RepID=UPI0000ED6EFE|nr:phospholipase D family protein [Anaeromyxobacter sp. Fw109-5]ABS28402.1 hypothetical protein Anae109_4224 [Anaeromyxobacter sp. Fw109-5]